MSSEERICITYHQIPCMFSCNRNDAIYEFHDFEEDARFDMRFRPLELASNVKNKGDMVSLHSATRKQTANNEGGC
jgi:hypothetical protein